MNDTRSQRAPNVDEGQIGGEHETHMCHLRKSDRHGGGEDDAEWRGAGALLP